MVNLCYLISTSAEMVDYVSVHIIIFSTKLSFVKFKLRLLLGLLSYTVLLRRVDGDNADDVLQLGTCNNADDEWYFYRPSIYQYAVVALGPQHQFKACWHDDNEGPIKKIPFTHPRGSGCLWDDGNMFP